MASINNTGQHEAGDVWGVILAGGSGSRLWPLSRQQLPKQFLPFGGQTSLLEATIRRLEPLVAQPAILVVTGEELAKGEAYQTLLPYQTLLEPVGRNTAPAIALAAAFLHDWHHDPVMVVLPADHFIRDEIGFRRHLSRAIEIAREGKLVTFGIQPSRPETGYGYIGVTEERRDSARQPPYLLADRFTEKPDRETAERFLKEGGYYWNSGMFVWRASVILSRIETCLPQLHGLLSRMRAEWSNGRSIGHVVKEHFQHMPAVSIDHGVLEKSQSLAVIPCDIGWSDIGSWDALYEMLATDAGRNAIQGNVMAMDCRDSLFYCDKRLVAAIGLENLCVIDTADAILIARRGETQRVREVVNQLEKSQAKERVIHRKVQRPWGTYTVLEDQSAGCKIKRIEVLPGRSLSLQRHRHRSEHWVVVSGTATVVRSDETITVAKNESTYIPIGVKHRLENRSDVPVHIIEVQVGDYVEEDDIERFDDSFGRA